MTDFVQFSYFAKNKIENLYHDSLIKLKKGYLNINHIIIISDILSERIKFTIIEHNNGEINYHDEYQLVKYFTIKTIDNEIYFCLQEELNKFINAKEDNYIS